MATDRQATVNVPEELLKPIIEAKVIEALGGQQLLLDELVRRVLDTKVRDDDLYRDVPLVESLCKKALKQATTDAVKLWIENNQQALTDAIAADMRKRTRSIAKALVDGFASTAKSSYHLKVNVGIVEKDR